MTKAQTGNITFADNNVLLLCCDHWDTDHDGSLSYAEAAAVTSLGTMFQGNTTITKFSELEYFTSLETIDASAFEGCTSLERVGIPNSVTSIGSNAFKDCSAMERVYVPSIDRWCGITFANAAANPLSNNAKRFYVKQSSGIGYVLLTSLSFPESVTAIPNYAFYGFNGDMGGLTLSSTMTSIGDYAFYECSGFAGDLVIPNSVTSVGQTAFAECTGFTGNLIIGNSVTSIVGSFQNCTGFTGCLILGQSLESLQGTAFLNCGFSSIIVYAHTPPSSFSDFNGVPTNIPIYVPYGTKSQYTTGVDKYSAWSQFDASHYVEQYNFQYDEYWDTNWSNDDNWTPMKPISNDVVVCVTTNCHLDENVNVLHLYMQDNADVLTIGSGKTLTTTYGVGTRQSSQLVIAEGGQLVTNYATKGTVQKHINAFSSANDGWNFIASPVTESLTANFVGGLIPSGETVYDLYYLDEENTYWRNYKQNAFELNLGQGYLYANGAGTTINFSGILQPYVASGITIPLSNAGDGWNLVGNPFTFNAYANKSYYVINGRNVETAVSGAIAPCTGIVVKATDNDQTVTFTKDDPSMSNNHGNLNIVLAEQMATRGGASTNAVDNAIVSFSEGSELEKFVFNEDNAKLYFSQKGQDYAIAFSDKQSEMPLNFKAMKNGEYTITVNPEGLEMEYLHLIDNMTGADIDLLATNDGDAKHGNAKHCVSTTYTFTAKTTDYESRFRLVFNANSANGDTGGEDEAFAFVGNGEIVITGLDGDACNASLQVVDVLGRVCRDAMLASPDQRVSTARMTPGVYVLRLINGNNVRTQKMVIQ